MEKVLQERQFLVAVNHHVAGFLLEGVLAGPSRARSGDKITVYTVRAGPRKAYAGSITAGGSSRRRDIPGGRDGDAGLSAGNGVGSVKWQSRE
jgi:hypothetical protein